MHHGRITSVWWGAVAYAQQKYRQAHFWIGLWGFYFEITIQKNLTKIINEIKIVYLMCQEMWREPIDAMLQKPLVRNKIQYVPFQPVTCLNSEIRIITNAPHICTLCCVCAAMSFCRFWFILEERKQRPCRRQNSRLNGPVVWGLPQCVHTSHTFKLIDALFGISWPDLSQGLVLVSSCFHVLCVDHVIHRLLGLIPSVCQLWAQSLEICSSQH